MLRYLVTSDMVLRYCSRVPDLTRQVATAWYLGENDDGMAPKVTWRVPFLDTRSSAALLSLTLSYYAEYHEGIVATKICALSVNHVNPFAGAPIPVHP